MTLEELPWVPVAMYNGVYQAALRNHAFWHTRRCPPGTVFVSNHGNVNMKAGTYTVRSDVGEEWINLDPIEALCVLNYLLKE